MMVIMGCNMDPHQAYLVHRGLKTLAVRIERAQKSAIEIARWLESRPEVAWVRYIGLPSHPQHALAAKQMTGFGSMISFEMKGGIEAGKKLMDSVKLAMLAVSLGGVETLIEHPASMTHAGVPRKERETAGHHRRSRSLLRRHRGYRRPHRGSSPRTRGSVEEWRVKEERPDSPLRSPPARGEPGRRRSRELARVFGAPVQLLDCDVEEPNDHLFLKGTPRSAGDGRHSRSAGRRVALRRLRRMREVLRVPCDRLVRAKPLVFPELCHGCGGCTAVCPTRAISEVGRRIGVVETMHAGNITLIQGRLDVGVAMAPPLIREVRARVRAGMPAILDAPPGTSCPVIAAVRGADLSCS